MSHLARSFCLLGLATLASAALAPAAAHAQDIHTASQVFDITLSPATDLATNSVVSTPEELCPNAEIEPKSAAGQKVAAAGWIVIDEESQGDYTYVAFAGKTMQGTSGSCEILIGNLGIFKGEQIVARAEMTGDAGSLGKITTLEPDGVRIWSGDYLPQPVADLRNLPGDLFLLRPIAERDNFCEGRTSVPSLYGLPVGIAWMLLREEGWTVTQSESSGDDAPAEEWVLGRQDCSGTGFGFCAFAYDHVSGQSLNITTAGETEGEDGPSVVDYEVSCE